MATTTHTDVLIVGAGIAGLMAAHAFIQPGAHILIIEKEPRAGGRMATRHLGAGLADTGAQFFTVRTPEFRPWMERWLDKELVYKWSMGWSDGSLGATPPDGHPRYAVHGGMSALADFLARDLNVIYDTRIVSISPQAQGWQVRDEKSRLYTASALVLTPPVPLALELLNAENVSLSAADQASLEHIEYAPCLAGIFAIQGEIKIPEPGAIQRPNAAITWIADNQRKGISRGVQLITVHAGTEYSRQLWGLPDWEVLVALESGLRLYRDYNAHTIESRLERWRYALPTSTHPERCLVAEGLPPLVFAGDAFGTPRIEGAALSGLAAGVTLSARMPFVSDEGKIS
jgi:renalase